MLLNGQNFSPYFHNFTKEDGLPSSEVYCVLQDKEGYMWFGTDNGVARFNGYEFKVYDNDDGLEDVVVFKMREDRNGVVWANTYTGRLFYLEGDRFLPHPNNDRLASWKIGVKSVELIDPDFREGFLFKVTKTGLVYWDGKDCFEWLEEPGTKRSNYFYEMIPDSRFPNVNPRRAEVVDRNSMIPTEEKKIITNYNNSEKWETEFRTPDLTSYQHVIAVDTAQRATLTAISESYLYTVNGKVAFTYPRQEGEINYVLPASNEGLLLCMSGDEGLVYLRGYENEATFQANSILKDQSISFANYDRTGGLWVCSLDKGIFYSANPDLLLFNEKQGLPSSSSYSVAVTDNNSFFASYSGGEVYYYSEERGGVHVTEDLFVSGNQITLYFDHPTNLLFGAYPGLFRLGPKEEFEFIARKIPDNRIGLLNVAKSYQLSDWGPRRLLHYGGISEVATYDFDSGEIVDAHSNAREGPALTIHTYKVDYSDRHWLGTLHGLYEYLPEQGAFVPNDLGQPVLKERIVKIEPLASGGFLFGSRGNGLIYYDQDTCFSIRTSDGLASDMVRDIHIDERGIIWVATLAGLSRINFSGLEQADYNYTLKTFDAEHGLVSEEIYDIDSYEEDVWLATSKGVIKFIEPSVSDKSTVPIVGEILLNGQKTTEEALRQLAVGKYQLSLGFYTISYRQNGQINYRYRLNATEDWVATNNIEVSFPDLPAGGYNFEVQSQNENGIWSESLFVPINIAAPWHATIWGRLGLALLLVAGVSVVFYRRERQRSKIQAEQLAINNQMNKLERSALHAQMNPHFIFNSLNSIQSFILEQDTKSAVDYLARFARLIRDTLRVSAQGEHTLEEELQMLKNYLDLEKLRFKEGFEYRVEIEEGIVANQLVLPPLLIQPFVENAIKHGIEGNDRRGEVAVQFSRLGEQLRVSVQDNGRGYDPRESKKSDGMGMDITRRRLELLQKRTGISVPMDIRFQYDDEGVISGTEISIIINAKKKIKKSNSKTTRQSTNLIWALLLIANFSSSLQAQSFAPHFHNFTKEDGLPSSEVYCALQDKEGYMWFGTDNGIARFNGYEFKVYDNDDGLEDVVVFKMREDRNGRIWANTYTGRLYYLEEDRFLPHPNNDRLEAWKTGLLPVELIDPDFRDGFLFQVFDTGLVYWDGEDCFEWLTNQDVNNSTSVYDFIPNMEFPNVNLRRAEVDNRVIIGEGRGIVKVFNQRTKNWDLLFENQDRLIYEQLIAVDTAMNSALITMYGDYIYTVDDEEVYTRPREAAEINYVLPASQGGLLLCTSGDEGLLYLKDYQDPNTFFVNSILKDLSISFANYDRAGGLWVCSLGKGVFYSANPEMSLFDESHGLPFSNAYSVAAVDSMSFFASYSGGKIFYHSKRRGGVDVTGELTYGDKEMLYFDHPTQQLFGAYYGLYRLGPEEEIAFLGREGSHHGPGKPYSAKSYQLSDWAPRRLLHFAGVSEVATYDFEKNKVIDIHTNVRKGPMLTTHTYSVDYSDRHWVGTLHGLYEYLPEQKKYIPNDLGQPVLQERIVKIEPLKNGGLLLGSRGKGVIYYNQDTCFSIGAKEGLASDMVRDLHIDERGNIWIATLTGLSKLIFGNLEQADYSYHLRSFGVQHGLVSDEIYDIDSHGDDIWLATEKGVIKFVEPTIVDTSAAPVRGDIALNSQKVKAEDLQALAAGKYQLSLGFYTINYRQLSQINYRYRLSDNSNWIATNKTEVSFLDLPAGLYRFEVQSQNEDGVWSEGLFIPINIANPWYNHWLTRLSFLLLFSAAISGFYIQRDRRRRASEAIARQIQELERSALHAQMNPHFVFNSLNSIQSFILDKDTRSAVDYLAQFARLIRDTLRVSAEGRHSLEEEIIMLRNYLNLEKLRFKEGLSFSIEVEDHLVPSQIDMPALLIQPFVENAIKHGIREQDEGGEVIIRFRGTQDQISVSIEDNGPGFDPDQLKTDKPHHGKKASRGMDITRRRLELLQKKSNQLQPMDIQFKYDDDGDILGTEVVILIDTERFIPSKPETSQLIKPRQLGCFLLFCFGMINTMPAQNFSPYFHNFTKDDGLPSSEVYCALQDKEGYMWFGTDNGIARFNGYEFKIYDNDDGLKDVVVFKMREDRNGRIWANTYTGRLYYLEEDRFLPHPKNDRLEAWKTELLPVELIDPDFRDGFLFQVFKTGLVYWDGEECFEWLTNQDVNKSTSVYESIPDMEFPNVNLRRAEVDNRVVIGEGRGIVKVFNQRTKNWDLLFENQNRLIYEQLIAVDTTMNSALITMYGDYIYTVGGEEVYTRPRETAEINYVLPASQGGLLLCTSGDEGLLYLKDYQDPNTFFVNSILKDLSISFANYDRAGGLWVCSLGKGVFYSANPEMSLFDESHGLPLSNAYSVAAVDSTSFFASYSGGKIFYHSKRRGGVNITGELTNGDKEMLYFDHPTQQLFGAYYGLYRLGPEEEIAFLRREGSPYGPRKPYSAKSYQLSDWGPRRLLHFGGISEVATYDFEKNKVIDIHTNVRKGPILTIHTYSVDYSDRHWVGTLHGLYEYLPEQKKYIPNDLGQPVLQERIVKIEPLKNGGLLLGSRGKGVIYYNQDTCFSIGAKEGLASDMVRDLHIDERGNIWIATLTGLSKLIFGNLEQADYSYHLRSFGVQHGLVSDEIYDIDSHGDDIWLATEKGVIKFVEPTIVDASAAPVRGDILLNSQKVKAEDLQALAAGKYQLSLGFYTINYQQLGQINYRYRLNTRSNWVTTNKTEVIFPDLSAGLYHFEVQSQNEDGVWSEGLFIPINIAAPWHDTVLGRLLMVLLLILCIAAIFYQRELERNKKQTEVLAINRQINDLERSALHAQMNPHFIFNSLNSIQSFILDQDTKSAVDYLARFARLIRDTLRVSVRGEHSLDEELQILRSYLDLEKLRFKEGFEYEIELEEGIIASQVMLPPMLIQPFVENAIKHGIEGNNKQGVVRIVFGGLPEELQVTIQDNGKGFDLRKSKRTDAMGMDITRRRLEIMQGEIGRDTPMEIQLRYDNSGQVIGTEIIISIKAKRAIITSK